VSWRHATTAGKVARPRLGAAEDALSAHREAIAAFLLLLLAFVPHPGFAEQSGPMARVGLERVAAGEGEWDGKKIGLVVHAASVTEDGRHAIDVFRDRGLDVVRLFSPEHGLRGRAAAGEKVDSGRDPVSGLPVVSLYGEHRKPSADDLAGLDLLIFDLQGGGVRFYTYVSTLVLCLEAAAEAGLDLVVLDRPNPLGGERVEGPVSAPRERMPRSFVNTAPGPLVHGLTLGEMARLVHAGLEAETALDVVEMEGWERSMTWAETGRAWISPSPNLRSAEAALAYPGTALLESTNISEGRGTEAPFLLVGAPWLDPEKVAIEVPGFALEPTDFTPVSSPAAPDPKFAGEAVRGLRVRVTDVAAAEPYRLGVALLVAARRYPETELRRGGDALTWLIGTDRLLADLEAGKSVDEIVAADRDDHKAWRERRRPFLLYEP
jgi:uncharacterized protein YbbC (DUF1343 family)